jgi:MerR-like DNA binding protein
MTSDRLTEDEVAERVGTTPGQIRRLAQLGILEPEDGTYPRRDVLRARVVVDLDAMGIDADAVARARVGGPVPRVSRSAGVDLLLRTERSPS